MEINFLTVEEFRKFKNELLEEIKQVVKNQNSELKIKWVRTRELKKCLWLSDSQIQTMRINGALPYTTLGKTYYYNLEEIAAILDKNATNSGKINKH
jgi:hypothetical protein